MRNFLALVFSAGLVVLLFLVVTANHALNTISEPDVIISVLNDAEAYDYLYDEIIGNLVYDVVEKGVEVNSGIGESSSPTILEFDDPVTAAAAITSFVEKSQLQEPTTPVLIFEIICPDDIDILLCDIECRFVGVK